MRVATFNLESLDRTSGTGVRLEDRFDVLRPQLLRLNADILCLQEVNGQHRKGFEHRSLDALHDLLAETPYAGYERAATMGPGREGVADVHNLVTLSRWPIVESREIRNTLLPPIKYMVSTAHPPILDPVEVTFDRAVLISEIGLGDGTELSVINVHLRAPLATPIRGQKEAPFVWNSVSGWAEGFFLSGLKRAAQALETRLMIDRIMDADPHRLIVVTGDFNAADHETPLKILVGAEEDTGNGKLTARSLVVLDRSVSEDRRFSVLHHGRPTMFDHMLVSRAALAHFRAVEIHNETLSDELVAYGKTRHLTASYHAPLVAEFSVS